MITQCNREGCDDLWDLHSHDHGYICGECFNELLNRTDLVVADFMHTDKNDERVRREVHRQYVTQTFPRRRQ